jgi:serine/threonine protein kinase
MVLQVFARRDPQLSDEAKRFLHSLPPAFATVLRKRRRLLPVWSSHRYCVAIKSSFLVYHRDDAAVTNNQQAAAPKDLVRALKFVNLQQCRVKIVDDDRHAGFVLVLVPTGASGGHAIYFAADSEKDRARLASAIAAVQRRAPPNMRDFTTLKLLGRGHYGRVLLARLQSAEPHQIASENADDARLYAIKEMKLGQVKAKVAYAERSVMEWVGRHPFLLPLDYALARGRAVFLVSPFLPGGDLFVHLQNHGGALDERAVRFYGAELVLALEHLHNMSIVHRDIKPENVLLGLDGHVKLADMGLAKRLASRTGRTTTMCGTDTYLPPEMVARAPSGHGLPVDFWQLGCLLFELRSGYPPFYLPQSSQKATHQRILQLPVRYPRNMSAELQDLVARLLEKRPEHRLGTTSGMAEVKTHAFFRGVNWDDVLRKQVTPPLMPRAVTPENLVSNFDPQFTEQPHQLYVPDELGDELVRDFAGFDYCRPATPKKRMRLGENGSGYNGSVTANESFVRLSADSTSVDDGDEKPEVEVDTDAVRIKI